MKINKFDGEYAWLSNFYESPIVDEDGLTYPTVEHYFQAMKTLDMEERRKIAAAETPGQAKRYGRRVHLRYDWEVIKFDVMETGLRKKFEDPILKEKLIATGDKKLIEGNYWHDNIWGSCYCGNCNNKGANHLGRLLMKIRKEIQ